MNLDKIIVLDVETSGLDPARHAIVEIGACQLVGEKEFSMRTKLPFGREWEMGALDVNGFTLAEITDITLPLPWMGLHAMFEHFGWEEWLFAGQNLEAFDKPFMRATMKAQPGIAWPKLRQRSLDMHSVAIAYAPWAMLQHESEHPLTGTISPWETVDVMKLDTDAIYALLGLPPEPKPHRALQGARCERAALRLMLGID